MRTIEIPDALECLLFIIAKKANKSITELAQNLIEYGLQHLYNEDIENHIKWQCWQFQIEYKTIDFKSVEYFPEGYNPVDEFQHWKEIIILVIEEKLLNEKIKIDKVISTMKKIDKQDSKIEGSEIIKA